MNGLALPRRRARCALAISTAVLAAMLPGASTAFAHFEGSFDAGAGELTIAQHHVGNNQAVVTCGGDGKVKLGTADAVAGGVDCSAVEALTVEGEGGNETFDVDEVTSGQFTALASLRVEAGGGNNTVYGSPLGDDIVTGSGNDTVHAGDGDDLVLLGGGNDTAFGGGGDDGIDGEAGFDSLNGEAGADELLARDSAFDHADCGDDADSVVADRQDQLVACESADVPADAVPAPAQPPAPGPAADKAGPNVLLPQSLTLTPRGARFEVMCDKSEPGPCVVKLHLATAGRVAVAKARRRKLSFGSRTLTLQPGQGATVRLRLSKRNKAALARMRRIRLKLTATARDSAGNVKVTSRTVIVQLRKPGGGHHH